MVCATSPKQAFPYIPLIVPTLPLRLMLGQPPWSNATTFSSFSLEIPCHMAYSTTMKTYSCCLVRPLHCKTPTSLLLLMMTSTSLSKPTFMLNPISCGKTLAWWSIWFCRWHSRITFNYDISSNYSWILH